MSGFPGRGRSFPATRLRRLRRTRGLRELTAETRVAPSDLVLPLFIESDGDARTPVTSMPGVHRLGVEAAAAEAAAAAEEGVLAVLLFGIPAEKDAVGSTADDPDGVVQRAARRLRERAPALTVITDLCLCEYTDHGHCGIVEDGDVANDPTVDRLAAVAVSHARAGADIVAPSDMMDGRIGAVRAALDEAGHEDVAILSYAAKYASAFYGPFRDAADSSPAFGDRRSYQMDPRNGDEALHEVALDVAEGADLLMVKPGLPCLDVLARVKATFRMPTVAYMVSGEYAMIESAAEAGRLDAETAHLEAMISLRRAGADLVVTYAARRLARLLARHDDA